MGTITGALQERDIVGTPFNIGEYVLVRCLVSAIQPVSAGGNGGPADLITLVVESPGNVGEKVGVTFVVSPVQCRKTGNATQA